MVDFIEPFWGLDVYTAKEIQFLLNFYNNIAMGEHLEDFLTPEEAIFVLYADFDLRIPKNWGRELEAYTVYTNWSVEKDN